MCVMFLCFCFLFVKGFEFIYSKNSLQVTSLFFGHLFIFCFVFLFVFGFENP